MIKTVNNITVSVKAETFK